MRAIHIGIVLALTAPAASAATVTVATYNVKHGQGNDGVVDLSRQARIMSNFGAGIIGVQENDIANGRTGFVNQPQTLAGQLSELTGASWMALEAPAIAYSGGQYGNAILYNDDLFNLDGFENLGLPDPAGDGARSAGIADFTTSDGYAFSFLTTHLTHRNEPSDGGSTVQLDSIAMIEAALDPSRTTILTGDFNATVDAETPVNGETIEQAMAYGWRFDSPLQGTSTPAGERVIDFIATKGGGFDFVSSGVFGNNETDMASDHYPVTATYSYQLAPVPLPGAAPLLLFGIGAFGALARRRRHY